MTHHRLCPDPRRWSRLVALLGPALLAPSALAQAASEPAEVLARIDAAMSGMQDQTAELTMTIATSGSRKVRALQLKQKGSQYRLVRLTAPAELRGVTFLKRGEDELYIYLPEVGKPRRIASHVKNESFLGSDLSYDDLGQTSYASRNHATVLSEDDQQVTLELRPRVPEAGAAERSVLTVDKQTWLVRRAELFRNGQPWKVMLQEQPRQLGRYWVAQRITMRNLSTASETIIELGQQTVDTGLSDDEFSQRVLRRGR